MTKKNSDNAVNLESSIPDGRIVYVIDDNAEIRKSLHFALSSSGITVWPFGRPKDFLDLLDGLTPAPIIVDVRMPEIDGVRLLELIRERDIEWPVIMMTAHGEISIAVSAMKLGALDFIEKPFKIEHLEDLLSTAHAKSEGDSLAVAQRQDAADKFATLTGREKEVTLGFASGLSNKQIGEDLHISVRTVEVHRAAALKKLKVKSTAEVVQLLLLAGHTLGGSGDSLE
ncbi:response regulator transcription factor [Parablastomonas sp. CN1-191]|uniref:response regulator transcription factor n=1 Tax=Parablastomonas sp. CN1-191 TaxID=3400908 RepID=UPI003BF8BB83